MVQTQIVKKLNVKLGYTTTSTRSLVLYICFVDRCLSFWLFLFGHCVVCSSSMYGFWLPLWYLQTLMFCRLWFVLFILLLYVLWLTASGYPVGILNFSIYNRCFLLIFIVWLKSEIQTVNINTNLTDNRRWSKVLRKG
jgi:hypothetical protein